MWTRKIADYDDGDHPWGCCEPCAAQKKAEEAAEYVAHQARNYAAAKERYEEIVRTLEADGEVMIVTCTKATRYDKRHVGMFRLVANGLFVQHGKSWNCLDGCALRFGHKVKRAA